jgi:hypothetical protein
MMFCTFLNMCNFINTFICHASPYHFIMQKHSALCNVQLPMLSSLTSNKYIVIVVKSFEYPCTHNIVVSSLQVVRIAWPLEQAQVQSVAYQVNETSASTPLSKTKYQSESGR